MFGHENHVEIQLPILQLLLLVLLFPFFLRNVMKNKKHSIKFMWDEEKSLVHYMVRTAST